jgi:hypothetical protein
MATKPRPIAHIALTPALEAAIAAAPKAICPKPADPLAVRECMATLARSFEDPTFFYADEAADESKALETLIQVATLYLEHIRAGNLNDRKD